MQGGQVIKGIEVAQIARVDEAHEQIADERPVLGLVEERVLSVMQTLA